MENEAKDAKKPFNSCFCIVITQIIFVTVILIGVLVIKYFFKDTYNRVKVFYENQICADTDVGEVLSSEGKK